MDDRVSALREVFERIYEHSAWGQGSGPGSTAANTIEYRAFISRFIEANGVRSVTDLGCGDWQFSRLLDWSDLDYLGLDVVPEVVERNRGLFGKANIRFDLFTSLDSLPGGDLLLSKEVLQHLPNSIVIQYLEVIKQKYRFALLTNAIEPGTLVNGEIVPGDWRPIRLENPPFNARGAVVFTYFPQLDARLWKNAVFLMFGFS